MLRRICTIAVIITIIYSNNLLSQTYKGPEQGSVVSGAVVNTNSFAEFSITDDTDPIIRGEKNLEGINTEPLLIETTDQEVFPTTYIDDSKNLSKISRIGDNAMLLEKFNVALDNNVIPPDPTIAVGPNHVMVLTNNGVGIRIYDKQGTLLRSINSSQWWSAVWPSQSGDPQILYDHFSNRWVMVFMQVDDGALTAGNLLAYSDDSDPLGTWYMYRLDTKTHGATISSTWGDYPQIGFDEQAIYIMTRCFTFGGGFNYTKLRIISKAELYTSNAGPLTYNDLWDITLPGQSTRPDVIHPSFQYTNAGEHYLVYSPRSGGYFNTLYKITNPVTSPVLTGVNISVPFFGGTPNANQLGGSTVLIESNGSHMKTAPVFRDGYLYATHSIRNSVFPNYSSIKYVKINVATNSVVESAELGADKYFYIYPAIAVDKDGNVGITCSRSGDNEYIGSYFVTRRSTDSPGLSPATELQKGLGNYVITFSGTRNRWGDYLGAFIDPADDYSFWMVSQYASGTNAYACAVGQVRLKPFEGIYVYPETHNYNFGSVQTGNISDTITVFLSNYGSENFIISSIPDNVGDFQRVSSHIFPITLSTYDSIEVRFRFNPATVGEQNVLYPFTDNSSTFQGVNLTGRGYEMNTATEKTMYAVSGTQNNGQTLIINSVTGTGTNLGLSNYNDLRAIAINPETNQIYAVRSSSAGSSILEVNATLGDAYPLFSYPLSELFSIAFDSNNDLYGSLVNGQIYKFNLSDGTYTLISTMKSPRVAIRFNLQNNELWGTVKNFLGNPKDQIVKINLATGDTTRIGRTSFNVNTLDLAFDESGSLYGIKGSGFAVSDLFSIDQNTGKGTLIGSIGLKDLTGICYSSSVTSIDDVSNEIPNNFNLSQNYPNPFNPSTQINFSLPVNADVKITIYNLLGETILELINSELNSGTHSVVWNSEDSTGKKVSSGVYFYELKANSSDGKQFNQIRKMVLLK